MPSVGLIECHFCGKEFDPSTQVEENPFKENACDECRGKFWAVAEPSGEDSSPGSVNIGAGNNNENF